MKLGPSSFWLVWCIPSFPNAQLKLVFTPPPLPLPDATRKGRAPWLPGLWEADVAGDSEVEIETAGGSHTPSFQLGAVDAGECSLYRKL